MTQEAFERVRVLHQTQVYKKAMNKRKVWVEPLFVEGKEWHGRRRFRLRLLWRINIEVLMRATGQHLKRFLKKRGGGRRLFPAEVMSAFFFAVYGLIVFLGRLLLAWPGGDRDGHFDGRGFLTPAGLALQQGTFSTGCASYLVLALLSSGSPWQDEKLSVTRSCEIVTTL